MNILINGTFRQMIFFYVVCAILGTLLSFVDFQGIRESLELGAGGYFENLRKEWTFSRQDGGHT